MKKINENYVGWLLLASLILSLGLIGFDGSGGGFAGSALAQSDQSNSDDQLKAFDHIILTWTGSPATTQAVTWRSQVEFRKSVAEIAPAKASPDFVNNAKQILAITTPLKIEENFVYYHSANFTGLDRLYAYRVGNGSIWSEWDQWFNAGGWILARIPSLPVTGNHEYKEKRGGGKRSLSKFWRPQFTLPENGISGLLETSYYLDYQGTRFVVLNSNRNFRQQARWLENVLKHNPNHWTIVVFHHPVYTSADLDRDNKKVRKHWQPLFEKFNVDLVLQEHDHVYSRGQAPGKTDGTVYVVSVGGPTMYNLARADWMDWAGENIQLFQIISITQTVLSFKSITATGEVFDAFDLVKKVGTTRKLINPTPAE